MDAVAQLAAAILGKEKDVLVGEVVRLRRRARRLATAAITGLAALTVISLVAGVLAIQNTRWANDEARVATAGELAARSRNLLATRPDQALLLAAAGYRLDPSVRTADGLLSALTTRRDFIRYLRGHKQMIGAVAVSPNNRG